MKNTIPLLFVFSLLLSSCSPMEVFEGFSYPGGRYKSLIMSYDDGVIQDIQLVELFNKHGIVGTFNLNSEYIGTTRGWPQENGDTVFQRYVPKDSLLHVYNNHEIAAHGAFHKDFINLTKKEILEEVNMDIAKLSELTNREIMSMAYPFGNTNDSIAQFISTTGISNARTVSDTYTFELPTNYLIWNPTCHDSKALDYSGSYLALDESKLSLFYIWGHSWEFGDEKRWNNMIKLCEQVGNRDDIWYVGCGQFTNYLKALDKVRVGKNEIVNPVDNESVWVQFSNGFKVLKPGEKLKISH